jgi:hypothetical protein
MSIPELGKLLTVFNIPDSNETIIITRNNRFKLCVVKCESNRSIMGSFAFFLSFEEPEINLARAQQDIVGLSFKEK